MCPRSHALCAEPAQCGGACLVQQHVPLDWYTRYGLRADQMRLPKEASKREALARQVGLDGYQLLDAVWAATSAPYLRTLPAGGAPADVGATILSL